jgi:hypothetical protein
MARTSMQLDLALAFDEDEEPEQPRFMAQNIVFWLWLKCC